MTQADPVDNPNADKSPDEARLAAYLVEHPDFLDRHPDALAALNAHHETGGAASLIERQVAILRATNRELQSRHAQLVETARGNEQRVVQLNQVARVLVAASSVEALMRGLRATLHSQLDVDAVYLGLDSEQALPQDIDALTPDKAASRALTNVFRRGKPICGALDADQARALFDDIAERATPLASAAAIPLGKRGTHGALVLASERDDRFTSDMGTLFLELTGQLVTTALRRLLGESTLP